MFPYSLMRMETCTGHRTVWIAYSETGNEAHTHRTHTDTQTYKGTHTFRT